MKTFKVGDIVYIKSTGDAGEVTKVKVSSWGQEFYFVNTTGPFVANYPFYASDLKLVEEELEDSGYSESLETKLRFSLLVPGFIEEMMGVMEFGAVKYEVDDWKESTTEKDCVDAAFRHLLAYKGGADFDHESGLSHFSHIATRLMMAYFHMQNNKGSK